MPRIFVITNPVAQGTFEQTNLCSATGTNETCLNKIDPQDPYTLSVDKLRTCVGRFHNVLKDPAEHEKHRDKFLRAAFIDIAHLAEVIRLSSQVGANHVKLYNGIDDGGDHFFFLAPITPDGRARDDNESVAAMCCCKIPPCPETLADRYIG